MLLAVPPYFRVLITLHSFMCIRSATRTSNLAHLPGKCFSSEDSHTEISKRFAWNALSRWHFISASLHLLYLHMFIVQNQKYYCIILRLCQRSHLSISECKKSSVKCEKYHWFLCSLFFTISILLFCAYSTTF